MKLFVFALISLFLVSGCVENNVLTQTTTIGDIVSNPSEFANKEIIVEAGHHGFGVPTDFSGDVSACENNPIGSNLCKCASRIIDETSCIMLNSNFESYDYQVIEQGEFGVIEKMMLKAIVIVSEETGKPYLMPINE